MFNKIQFILWVIVSHSLLFAQTGSKQNEINLTKLQTPTFPAASIINNQVGTISRPKSFRSLEASIFSNYIDQNGGLTIPNDFALEFSPYWAQPNLKISNEEFLAPTVSQSLIQNLAFSVSSTNNFVLGDSSKSNALGFGVRTMLFRGNNTILNEYNKLKKGYRISLDLVNLIDDIDNDSATVKELNNKYFEEVKKNKTKLFGEFTKNQQNIIVGNYIEYIRKHLAAESLAKKISKDDYEEIIDNLTDDFLQVDQILESIYKIRRNRPGFKLEVAGAIALDFPANQTDYSYIPKFGIWASPSYSFDQVDWFEFLGVVRFYHFNLDFYKTYFPNTEVFENTWDFGFRLVLKWEKFAFESEFVWNKSNTVIHKETDAQGVTTTESKTKNDFQYIINFNYQLDDDIILSYNFGKSFDPFVAINGNMISSLSLNLGFNSPTNNNLAGTK